MPATTVAMPHVRRHQEHAFVCPCCGHDEETTSDGPQALGSEVFESGSCPACKATWRNEYRLYATRHKGSDEVALAPSQPLAALKALEAASWLDVDPSDSDELAEAKAQAREAIAKALQPN